jgi:hypothetical protein
MQRRRKLCCSTWRPEPDRHDPVPGVEAKASELAVIANGIPSEPIDITVNS